ncbi:MAG TPA: NERD domain-containing protein, partial [Solibacillus sp.]
MALVLIVVALVIISYFMVNIYRHDNSPFYKLTGYSYLDMLASKKIRKMYKIVDVLNQVNGPHKILVDVQIPVNDEQKSIDAVLLHESGIYVIDMRAKSG